MAAEKVSASRKLGREDAAALLADAGKLIVAQGRSVQSLQAGPRAPEAAIEAMLGPTGNLRAPTIKVGKTLVVGFDDESYRAVFGL